MWESRGEIAHELENQFSVDSKRDFLVSNYLTFFDETRENADRSFFSF